MAKSILVADDDITVLQLLSEHLKSLGYQVQVAPDGLQLGVMAQNHKPDLVIADLMMPAAGGARAYARLQSLETTKDIPVLFITGINMDEARQMVPTAPHIVLLSKTDCMFDKLDAAVKSIIGPAD